MKKHIDDLTNEELDGLCALAQWTCRSTNGCWLDEKLRPVVKIDNYRPTSPTEQGMAQCFQLMVKLLLPKGLSISHYPSKGFVVEEVDMTPILIGANIQIVICKAVVMSKYGEEVEV